MAENVEMDQKVYDELIAAGKSERIARSKAKAAAVRAKKEAAGEKLGPREATAEAPAAAAAAAGGDAPAAGGGGVATAERATGTGGMTVEERQARVAAALAAKGDGAANGRGNGAATRYAGQDHTHRLLAMVPPDGIQQIRSKQEDKVYVWPHLIASEFIALMAVTLFITALSVLPAFPLRELANPNITPNPSKAPWYFLNLQEMLLHMDAGLAGVIIPTIALGGIAAIPYIDRSPLGVGILGTSSKGRKIIAFAAVFTSVALTGMVLLDEAAGRGTQFGIGRWLSENQGAPAWVGSIVLSSLIVLAAIATLAFMVKTIFRPTTRELIIALFTAFFVTYWLLSIFGTSFRGPGQELTWPWNLPLVHH